MTIRREGNAIIRDPFDPAAPGDYAAPPESVRAVRDALVGTKDKLYDLRDPGVLKDYDEVSRDIAGDHAVAVLAHRTLEHCIEVTVRAKPLGSFPAASALAGDLVSTFARPTVQADERDAGDLEKYMLVERREEEDFTLLKLRHVIARHEIEVALRVVGVPPRRTYEIALDRDALWRKSGHVVYDERNPRGR